MGELIGRIGTGGGKITKKVFIMSMIIYLVISDHSYLLHSNERKHVDRYPTLVRVIDR